MQTDEEVMKLYQNGNVAAFEILYNRYSSKVYGYLKKRIRDEEAANDIYQKVFLKLHENREKFDPSQLFAPWLFTMTRNLLIDWYRSKKEIPSDTVEETIDVVATEIESEVEITELVKMLPEKYREMVELRYFEDLDFEEIAKRTKIKEATVRKLVSRGVLKLKALVGGTKNET